MILIADSGATKTEWCLLKKKDLKFYFSTEGYNPYYVSADYIESSLIQNLPAEVEKSGVEEIYFYGAGCSGDNVPLLESVLKNVFPLVEHIETNTDMIGAVRALLGSKPGFAAILGTGTNTCLYDGKDISLTVDSLGFLLGDEGSGAFIGKKILADFLRNKMPVSVTKEFSALYNLNHREIINKVYHEPMANRFCANFTRFLSHPDLDAVYVRALLEKSFRDFFSNLVCCYPDYKTYTFNCAGSIGFTFKSVLLDVAAEFGMPAGRVMQSVIEDLTAYHQETIR